MGPSTGAAMPFPAPQKNWFERNWKWFVPLGCMSMLVLVAAFVAAIFGFVESTVKNSGAYKQALARAQTDPRVVESIGQPIRPGWLVSGSINVSGDFGEANISIPISGPKGEGKLYVGAKKIAGLWQFETLEVEVRGQPNRIDLLRAPQ